MPQVLCTCSRCRTKKAVVDGIECPGCWLDHSTRRNHEKKDAGQIGHRSRQERQMPEAAPSKKAEPVHSKTGTFTLKILYTQTIHCYFILAIPFQTKVITELCCGLLIWLHTKAGISRASANTILHALNSFCNTLTASISCNRDSTWGQSPIS